MLEEGFGLGIGFLDVEGFSFLTSCLGICRGFVGMFEDEGLPPTGPLNRTAFFVPFEASLRIPPRLGA